MSKKIIIKIVYLFVVVCVGQGCSGGLESRGSGSNAANPENFYKTDAFGLTEMRRLTRFEVENIIKDVFNFELSESDIDLLPTDINANTYFDNSYEGQSISPIVVSSYMQFAENLSSKLVNQSNFVSSYASCNPQGASDQNCLIKFLDKAGRFLLRRPLSSSESQTIAQKFINVAVQDDNFNTAVELSLQYFLINPEFLYRIEGASSTSLAKINDYEVASRMAFMIWGAGPDDELLQAAENGVLMNVDKRLEQAERMLSDSKAKRQWQFFHSMWLGYREATFPAAYEDDLRLETNKLLDRVIFETDQNWLNIFSADQTYVTKNLATYYNMPNVPSTEGWVDYTGGRGGGILAHGSFLSLGAKFNDTSPTLRGYEIYKRLACGEIGDVPLGVDSNAPPGQAGDCKNTRYHMRNTVGCASCHTITDNIGFGLENFGVFGAWRDTEPSLPSCSIDSKGDFWVNNFQVLRC